MRSIHLIEFQVNALKKMIPQEKLIEFPLLTTKFLGKKIPAAGGFYLRSLPTRVIKNAIKNYEKKVYASNFLHSFVGTYTRIYAKARFTT